MICTYIRSSSIGTYQLCPHKYLLEYNLGLKQPSNLSATIGNIVHKTMECLARYQLCYQNFTYIFQDDLLGEVHTDDCDPLILTEKIFYKTKEIETHLNLNDKHLQDCKRLVKKAIRHKEGVFDPRNCLIVDAEKFFDFPINRDWAIYEYMSPIGMIKDRLRIKGTCDLITKESDDTYIALDYKTGRRWNWAKNKPKEEEDLQQDDQLLLYHYALCNVYPNIETILFTIYFIKTGEPYTMAFDRSQLEKTEELIRLRYEQILKDTVPILNDGSACGFCPFNTKRIGKKTTCVHYYDLIREKGYDYVMQKYGDWKNLSSYQDGGGRKGIE